MQPQRNKQRKFLNLLGTFLELLIIDSGDRDDSRDVIPAFNHDKGEVEKPA